MYDWRDTVMIYSKDVSYGGVWHCPFPPEWVEKMRQAAAVCKKLAEEQIERRLFSTEEEDTQKEHFLSIPQDERGLPEGYINSLTIQISCDIYDYDTIPDVVMNNGYADWPFKQRFNILTA